jgi:hypothetical protein
MIEDVIAVVIWSEKLMPIGRQFNKPIPKKERRP